jgi:hypothetical protein
MSDEQRLNRRIYTRADLRDMNIKWCDSTMKRKIAAGEFPAPITPPGATRWWQVEAVDAALLDMRASRAKPKLVTEPPPQQPKPAADDKAEPADDEAEVLHIQFQFPPERDPSMPGWTFAARLNFIDQQAAVALAEECSSDEIREAIEALKQLDANHDVHLLRNVLHARASGQLPEPALPRRRH